MIPVFLDLDGTLTDPKPGITRSIVHALEALGHDAPDPDSLTWAIGPSLVDSFARLGVADPEAALGLYRARYTEVGLFENRVYEGIPEALAALRDAGHRLFVATAKPHAYAVGSPRISGLPGSSRPSSAPNLTAPATTRARSLPMPANPSGSTVCRR